MDGGLSVAQWSALWLNTHEATGFGWRRTEWPDGRSLIEQPNIAVNVLDLVGDSMLMAAQEAQGQPG